MESQGKNDKVFSRTSGGLNAQGVFYGAEIIVYIEGKNVSSDFVYDKVYYEALFKTMALGLNVKIKVLGNCLDVMSMYYKVLEGGVTNTLSIVDRDYDGILRSKIKDARLIYTYGYSWENDFWTDSLCSQVIGLLTVNKHYALSEYFKISSFAKRRLSFAHAANISANYSGESLFTLGKKGGDDGISMGGKGSFIINKVELSKIVRKIKHSPNKKEIIENISSIKNTPEKLIQGHYWEHLTLHVINLITKKYTLNKLAVPHGTIKNIAFNQFASEAESFLSPETKAHYHAAIHVFLRETKNKPISDNSPL